VPTPLVTIGVYDYGLTVGHVRPAGAA